MPRFAPIAVFYGVLWVAVRSLQLSIYINDFNRIFKLWTGFGSTTVASKICTISNKLCFCLRTCMPAKLGS
jgi:hypothetical protein